MKDQTIPPTIVLGYHRRLSQIELDAQPDAEQPGNSAHRWNQSSKKREKQRLACRAILHKLEIHLFGNAPSLVIDSNGKPGYREPNRYCSVSHSGEQGLVGVATVPIGVDIELDIPRSIKAGISLVADRPDQIFELSETKQQSWFYQRWCEIESASKLLGIDLNAGISLLKNQPTDITFFHTKPHEAFLCCASHTKTRVILIDMSTQM